MQNEQGYEMSLHAEVNSEVAGNDSADQDEVKCVTQNYNILFKPDLLSVLNFQSSVLLLSVLNFQSLVWLHLLLLLLRRYMHLFFWMNARP
jgi:hypothetical protein